MFCVCSFSCVPAILKTYLMYNFDPLKPHFYIVNMGLQGYTLVSYFWSKHRLWALVRTASAARNIECGHSLEPPRFCFD